MERKLLISWYDGEGLLIQTIGINGKGQMTSICCHNNLRNMIMVYVTGDLRDVSEGQRNVSASWWHVLRDAGHHRLTAVLSFIFKRQV